MSIIWDSLDLFDLGVKGSIVAMVWIIISSLCGPQILPAQQEKAEIKLTVTKSWEAAQDGEGVALKLQLTQMFTSWMTLHLVCIKGLWPSMVAACLESSVNM